MHETSDARRSTLDRSLERVMTVNWETVAWLTILVLAIVTRLWHLGDRAMSHDESLHTFYSWKLFIGEGYQHDPMMHGPLLYHATALSYFLFGVSDATARLLPVVAGLALVLSPLLVRKWLGRVGAVATGAMLLASPTVMYYSRYIRHDIPVELFTAVMAIGFLRYVDSRDGRWIVLAFAAAVGAITSAEMAYINGFVLITFIALALVAERLGGRRAEALTVALGAFGLGLMVFGLAAASGRIGDVTTKGLPLHTAMQVSFLLSGLGLVYSLGVGLLRRFRTEPGQEPPVEALPVESTFAGLTAERLFTRYSDVSSAVLPLVSGVVITGLGLAARRWFEPTGGSLLGAAGILAWLGGAVLVFGLAALVLGQAVAALGRRTNVALMGLGAVAVLLGWAIRAASAGVPADTQMAIQLSPGRLALILLAAGVLILVYGLVGWLLEDYERRGLARAIGRAPLASLGVGLAVAAVVYTLLFTTFFTQPDGIRGLYDSIAYWLEQHEVVRGDQPWYYYAIFTPMYEFVPLFLSLAAAWVYSRRPALRVGRGNDSGSAENPSPAARCFVPLLVTWSAANFWIYSWAGEKMPWLIVHLVVPLAFLAGRAVADMVDAADWDAMRTRGWQVAGLFVLTLITAVAWAAQQPFQGNTEAQLSRTTGWLLGLPVVALLLWALVRLGAKMGRRQAQLAVAMALAGLLFVVNVRYSLLANFVNDELATEYIVYAHGTPDDKLVYNTLLDMQARLGVNEPLTIAYDNEVSWPFTWYFRRTDWSEAHYVGEKPGAALTEDVVLVGSPNYGKFEPYLRDRYESIEYRRMWWPNEGYKHLTLEKLKLAIVDPKSRRNWMRILFFREYTLDPNAEVPEDKPLTDWYHHANMRLYVKKALVERLWPLAQGRPAGLADLELKEPPPTAEIDIEQTYDTGPDGTPVVEPKDVAVGPDGAVYVIDFRNNRIVVFEPDGRARQVVGAGAFIDPSGEPSAWGIGLGPEGEIYVADTWNHRIVRYVDGQQDREWGTFAQPDPSSPLDTPTAFYGPRDVAVGPDGNVYVADTGNKRISVFDSAGNPIRSYGGEGIEPGQFSEPTSLAFDPANGDIYVADLWNLRIQRFDRDFKFINEWQVDGWDSVEAAHKAYIAVGPGSTVIASDPSGGRVWIFDNTGTVLGTLDLLQDEQGLDQPIGVAVDAQGRIYVASSNSGLVTRYAAPEALLKAAGLASPSAESADAAAEQGEGAAGATGASDESGGESPTDATGTGDESGSEGAAPGGTGGDAGGVVAGPTAPEPTDAEPTAAEPTAATPPEGASP